MRRTLAWLGGIGLAAIAGCKAAPAGAISATPTDGATASDGMRAQLAPDLRATEVPVRDAGPASPHPFSVHDLLAMDRLSDHQISPDGQHIVFVRRVTDLEADKGRTDLWTVPVQGGTPQPLTDDPEADYNPRYSPDGETLFFLSTRSGSPQVWKMPARGGPAEPVTDLRLPVSNLTVSPTGDSIAYSLDVFVDCDTIDCTVDRLSQRESGKPSGMVYDQLFVRHWDTLLDGRRTHLFVQPLPGGRPIDVTAGLEADVPSRPFGDQGEFTFSPDAKTFVFSARVQGRAEAWSTDFDLYAVPATGGKPTRVGPTNPAWDTHPVFSPDGKTLAWMAMKTPGYEADRFGIHVMAWPDGASREVAAGWDRSASSIEFSPDGKSLLVVAQNLGQASLFRIGVADDKIEELVHDGTVSGPVEVGDQIVFARHDLRNPTDLHRVPRQGGEVEAITALNADRLAVARRGEPEQFKFRGAGGDEVWGYLVKPVDFDPSKQYPIAFVIHGGPQGSFGNMFHYRWNAQTYAGAGYAVVMIDFHGSTGYGQRFTDSIAGDWGGKPLTDLKRGLAHVIENNPWMDGDRVCALGASYGGFMINWIAGKWPERFSCLVNHDGVFDQRMMYYGTEELWFPEREHGGPHYERPQAYEKFNPVSLVDRWKTPMLVIHGALDYRVPPTQGLAAFTALQRRGVESQLLFFPDENHWVLRPSNSLQWHETVFAWMDRHLRR